MWCFRRNTFLAVNSYLSEAGNKLNSASDSERLLKLSCISVIEQSQIKEAVTSIFAILNGVLVAIAAISLIVGGIGIMNIMYITVTERIREIGIRRAMGATRRNILSQFLFEAVFLSFIGGSFGLIVSLVIVFIGSRYFPLAIDLMSVVVALTVSTTIGVVFGVLPARKAALLSPVEAIRYE